MDINERIDEFVKAADEVTANYWTAMNYTYSTPPTHKAQFISDKWCRIVTIENGRETSVYAFIALKDNDTKALGHIVTGDIHKAATYKAPAKHARANVFNPDFRKALTQFGIVYLR